MRVNPNSDKENGKTIRPYKTDDEDRRLPKLNNTITQPEIDEIIKQNSSKI
jgi:hypothetical protein